MDAPCVSDESLDAAILALYRVVILYSSEA